MTREEYRLKVRKYYEEHPEEKPMKIILLEKGIEYIKQEVITMEIMKVPHDDIKTYMDKRYDELREALGIKDESPK